MQGYVDMEIDKFTKSTDPFDDSVEYVGYTPTFPTNPVSTLVQYNKGATAPFRHYILSNYFTNLGLNDNRYAATRTATLYSAYNYVNLQPQSTPLCAQIPGEKDGTESINPGPGIQANVLSNPTSWSIKSFMKSQSSVVLNLINDFVIGKGLTPNGDANYSGPNLLYTSVPVVGTISDTNKTEIRNSIYYSMYFNFTDTSTTLNQICVGQDSPCNLYMFPDCSGMNEFIYNNGRTDLNQTAITHNQARRVLLTDAMLKVLPYQTQDYIRRWALARKARLIQWYNQQCEQNKNNTLTYNTYHVFMGAGQYRDIYYGTYVNNMKTYCCPLSTSGNIFTNDYRDDQSGTIDVTGVAYDGIVSLLTYSESDSSPMTCSNTSQIVTRSYNEALGDPSSPLVTADIAPKFNLMSVPATSPPVYIVKTSNNFTPTFTLDSTTNTYKNTITLDTSVASSLAFLVPGIYVNVANLTTPSLNSYEAVVDTYSNGTLNLKNITSNGIFINGTINTSSTIPGTLPTDYYTISYTDNFALTQESSSTQTVTALQISPTNNGSITLQIPLLSSIPTTFPNNSPVLVTNNSNASSNFTGNVQSINMTSSTLYASMTINNIGNINGTFTSPAVYAILLTSANPTQRFYLTTQEKQQILNMIAQTYYRLNSGTKKMQTIFDVYQVGDTIFDVRYSEYGRDLTVTQNIQAQMSALTKNYQTYRTYNLSEDQLLQLDQSYTSDMIQLNSELDNAVLGTGTNCGISAQYIVIKRTDINTRLTTNDTDLSGIQLSQVIVIDNTGNNAALNCSVSATSTYVYSFEAVNSYVYVTPVGNCTIASDGSIRDSYNNILSAAGTCNPVSTNGTQNIAPNCPIGSDGTISVVPPTSSSGDTAQVKSVKFSRNESIVDGKVNLNPTTGKYNTRVLPYFFRTAGVSNNESVTIDLGSSTDIVKVRLIFPKGYTDLPNYQVSFLDSNKNTINVPNTSPASLLTKSGKKLGTSDVLDLDCSTPNRSPDLPICPSDLLQPYKVARFYANISGYTPGNPTQNLQGLSFTGYSIGTNAALTFNPMYNAGFVLNLSLIHI